jgi:catechol 2,3-dioxygenase-like lactoylglutathione lyase family enzyme
VIELDSTGTSNVVAKGATMFEHIGLGVSDLDEFHRRALAAGGKDNGGPGLRPQYHANYYAAFVIGPDGHNVEVVCHG